MLFVRRGPPPHSDWFALERADRRSRSASGLVWIEEWGFPPLEEVVPPLEFEEEPSEVGIEMESRIDLFVVFYWGFEGPPARTGSLQSSRVRSDSPLGRGKTRRRGATTPHKMSWS